MSSLFKADLGRASVGLVAVGIVGALLGSDATAAFLTDLNGNGRVDLADAILSNTPPGNVTPGFTVGDKLFSNFAYTGTSNTLNGQNIPAPDADDIAVGQISLPNGDLGLRFGFGWFSINGLSMDSRIDYKVTVTDPNPARLIDKVFLTFNGTSKNAGEASVAETVFDAQGTYLGGLTVYGDPDGSGPLQGDQTDSFDLLPNQKSILVVKDIQVFSAPQANAAPNNTANISFVDNTYRQTTVPEPTSLALVLGLPALLLTRRRR